VNNNLVHNSLESQQGVVQETLGRNYFFHPTMADCFTHGRYILSCNNIRPFLPMLLTYIFNTILLLFIIVLCRESSGTTYGSTCLTVKQLFHGPASKFLSISHKVTASTFYLCQFIILTFCLSFLLPASVLYPLSVTLTMMGDTKLSPQIKLMIGVWKWPGPSI